jgi:hypothetical protein
LLCAKGRRFSAQEYRDHEWSGSEIAAAERETDKPATMAAARDGQGAFFDAMSTQGGVIVHGKELFSMGLPTTDI